MAIYLNKEKKILQTTLFVGFLTLERMPNQFEFQSSFIFIY